MGNQTDTGNFGHLGITTAEMESLASFCEAILPPVSPPEEYSAGDDHCRNKEALRSFFSTSGFRTPVVREVNPLFIHFFNRILLFNRKNNFNYTKTKTQFESNSFYIKLEYVYIIYIYLKIYILEISKVFMFYRIFFL